MRHADAVAAWRAGLDRLGPPRGVCGLCSGPDARHRQGDAVRGMLMAGEDVAVACAEHGLTVEDGLLVAWLTAEVEVAARRERVPRSKWWG